MYRHWGSASFHSSELRYRATSAMVSRQEFLYENPALPQGLYENLALPEALYQILALSQYILYQTYRALYTAWIPRQRSRSAYEAPGHTWVYIAFLSLPARVPTSLLWQCTTSTDSSPLSVFVYGGQGFVGGVCAARVHYYGCLGNNLCSSKATAYW